MKIFIDSNVFLFAYSSRNTNSSMVLANIDGDLLTPVVSYMVLDEVQARAKELYGKDLAGLIRLNVITLPNIEIVSKERIKALLSRYQSYVADRDDLPHICGYFAADCECFVTVNRHLTEMKIKELVCFKTPKEFVRDVLKLKPFDTSLGI
ncbi:MAG: hypothetical protein QMD78_01985 [Methanocellales archaeon]|nr:hypothetical protein [Methanocellales archaeon]